MQYLNLGSTGISVSAVSYGGIVSAGNFDGAHCTADDQAGSDRHVAWAVEQGVNYFDVAPSYGDAQQQLGKSLQPYRKNVHLACKTLARDRAGAEAEIKESMALLHTDYFDVYQMHAVNRREDVEAVFSRGGTMALLQELKQKGVIRNIGFSSHNEAAALEMLRRFDFDTVLFPFNWFMNMAHGMGDRLLAEAKKRKMGILCMKSMIESKWDSKAQRYGSRFPKSWCKPIDPEAEDFGMAAMKYALSLGVNTLIPPGNFASFSFVVDHIDHCLANPINDADKALLLQKLETVRGKEFFDWKI